ncbi:MAG: 3D domain-containing protein [Actinomycetota bacterium]|nr:3D domain-containing protein [Actinomycetota bacterium]
MPGETRTLRAWPIVLGMLLALSSLVPGTVAADSASSTRERASQLSEQNARLAGRSRSALLDLYALDSKLARERTRLVALRIRTSEIRAERAAARQRLSVARHSLSVAQLALAQRLQLLYEQGDSDPVAVILGASSVDEALSSLDSLDRIADQDRLVIEQARTAKRQLTGITRTLATRERALQRLADQAAQSTLELQQARAGRSSYLASLASQRRLNAAAISSLQQEALAVETKSRQLAAVASARPVPTIEPGPGGRTLTVTATGYAIRGRTATGAPTGWGVVAVDPSVIPLGTRMTIPGYGSGVAADTGSAIRGATIDLWFPSLAQARAWGRRTVTITLH